jgi:hypothetical protein
MTPVDYLLVLIVVPSKQHQYVSFAKTGLFSLNRDAISDAAITSSPVTERKGPNASDAGITSGEKQISRDINDSVLQLPLC